MPRSNSHPRSSGSRTSGLIHFLISSLLVFSVISLSLFLKVHHRKRLAKGKVGGGYEGNNNVPSHLPSLAVAGFLDNQAFIEAKGQGILMYSAYYDDRLQSQNGSFIRILALAPKKERGYVYCYFRIGTSQKLQCCGLAHRSQINTHKGFIPRHLSHMAMFYICQCENLPDANITPMSATILPMHCAFVRPTYDIMKPERWVIVLAPNRKRNPGTKKVNEPTEFTVCISPVRLGLSSFSALLRTLETNLLFGANRVVIYNYSLAAETTPFLKSYFEEGHLEVVNWPLRSMSRLLNERNVHYYGQNLAINDCLYRYMGLTKYLIISDLDEIIVPHRHQSWNELIAAIDHSHIGSHIFLHVQFEYNDAKEPPLYYMDAFLRTKQYLPLKIRSKMVVRPETVVAIGVHETFSLLPGYKQMTVDPNLALLHHYTNKIKGREPYRSYINDTRLREFRDQFRTQLSNRLKLMGNWKLPSKT